MGKKMRGGRSALGFLTLLLLVSTSCMKEANAGDMESNRIRPETEVGVPLLQLDIDSTEEQFRKLVVTYTYDSRPFKKEVDVSDWIPGEDFYMVYGYGDYPYRLLPWRGEDSIHVHRDKVLRINGEEIGVVLYYDEKWEDMISDPATILTVNVNDKTIRNLFAFQNLSAIILRSSTSQFTGSRDYALRQLDKIPHLRALYIDWGLRITDIGLKHIGELGELRWLVVRSSRITDSGLVHLANLKKLRYLDLSSMDISDTGMVHLSGLTELRELNLGGMDHFWRGGILVCYTGSRITAKGLKYLSRLTQLRMLDLSFNNLIEDNGLVFQSSLDNLEVLDLRETNVSGADLRHLAKLKNLRELDLQQTSVDGEGIAYLADLTNLERLNLSRNQITDSGIPHIAGLVNLETLNLRNTGITKKSLAYLKDMTELRRLDLSSNNLEDADFSVFSRMSKLEYIGLVNMNLENVNLSPLAKLKNLKEISLVHSGISSKDYKILCEALPDCWVRTAP